VPVANRPEYLTIEAGATDVIIGTAACHCLNMEVLYNTEHRGADILLPGTAGVIANPRRLTVVKHILQLVFNGNYDSDGNLEADPHLQVRLNVAEVAAVAAPVSSGDGTRLVTWTRPEGAVSADCHVGPLRIGERVSSSVLRATLDLSVPDGTFA
jgi:hypothetical protein